MLRAQLALVRAGWEVRTRPTGTLISRRRAEGTGDGRSRSSGCAPRGEGSGEDPGPAADEGLAEARRVGDAVRLAARRGVYRPRCLVRAIAVKRLLDGRGLDGARIRVGVREEGPELRAHAWVEYRGHVVGDFPESVRRFSDLDDLRVRVGEDAGDVAGERR